MLRNKSEFLSQADVELIHSTSVRLLSDVGIRFYGDDAVAIFNRHGVKTEGHIVYINEKQVMKALDTVPSQFTIHARNPEKDVTVGDGDPVFAPAYGAPFVVD